MAAGVKVVASPPKVDEEALFREAFEGVRPLGAQRAERLAVAPQPRREIVSEDAEVLAEQMRARDADRPEAVTGYLSVYS